MPDDPDIEAILEGVDELNLNSGGGGAQRPSPAGGGSGSNAAATAGFSARVDYELRAALGRLPKPGAAGEFIADLNAAFQFRDVAGRDEWTWKPRLNVGVGNFGGTTPIVQSIISRRAQALGDQALPILEQLRPLEPNADPEELEAQRNKAYNALSALVGELNRDGEIRESRVAQLFDELGVNPGTKDAGPARLGKEDGDPLIKLGTLFGFIRAIKDNPVPEYILDNITTLEEEQQLANFSIVRDAVMALGDMWPKFLKASGSFFSTHVFLLSRSLSVAEQAADDAFSILDSAYFGAAKRQVEKIIPATGQPKFPPISLEDFLSWTKSFVGSEAPEMIQETGKVGARSTAATLTTLHIIADAATTTVQNDRFKHPRVKRVWKELVTALNDARELAKNAAPEK